MDKALYAERSFWKHKEQYSITRLTRYIFIWTQREIRNYRFIRFVQHVKFENSSTCTKIVSLWKMHDYSACVDRNFSDLFGKAREVAIATAFQMV